MGLSLKPIQVVAAAAAVVTTVAQEGAEAHGAVGYEARTDDALPVHPDVCLPSATFTGV